MTSPTSKSQSNDYSSDYNASTNSEKSQDQSYGDIEETFFLLEKNTQAFNEQIQKKDERLQSQDKQINAICSRIKDILDKDVEESLVEDFEEGRTLSTNKVSKYSTNSSTASYEPTGSSSSDDDLIDENYQTPQEQEAEEDQDLDQDQNLETEEQAQTTSQEQDKKSSKSESESESQEESSEDTGLWDRFRKIINR
ncbi:MAG: hypothetical protein GF332_04085 [Candidatus Moranbacteria bacterium]|nr:hypothetical protein [Candidatus Moranbacteria bacterium]